MRGNPSGSRAGRPCPTEIPHSRGQGGSVPATTRTAPASRARYALALRWYAPFTHSADGYPTRLLRCCGRLGELGPPAGGGLQCRQSSALGDPRTPRADVCSRVDRTSTFPDRAEVDQLGMKVLLVMELLILLVLVGPRFLTWARRRRRHIRRRVKGVGSEVPFVVPSQRAVSPSLRAARVRGGRAGTIAVRPSRRTAVGHAETAGSLPRR